jgi:predicted Zn-dependent protease with MMP-like domain
VFSRAFGKIPRVDFDRFASRAEEILREMPPEFLRGVTGVEVHRQVKSHSQVAGFYTLGECASDEVTSLTDPGALRSRIHLYHGSFLALARADPDFDVEAELRETILHEVRHHIEDRAGIRDLLDEDAEDEALARFHDGQEMPRGWYRAGERMERGVWRVGDDLFVEVDLRFADVAARAGDRLEMTVLDERFDPEIPEDVEPGEILTYGGDGLERDHGGGTGDLHLVLPAD